MQYLRRFYHFFSIISTFWIILWIYWKYSKTLEDYLEIFENRFTNLDVLCDFFITVATFLITSIKFLRIFTQFKAFFVTFSINFATFLSHFQQLSTKKPFEIFFHHPDIILKDFYESFSVSIRFLFASCPLSFSHIRRKKTTNSPYIWISIVSPAKPPFPHSPHQQWKTLLQKKSPPNS